MSKPDANVRPLYRSWFAVVAFVLGLLASAHGQQASGTLLASREFTLPLRSEVSLEIAARTPGASWATKGAEAAAVLIEVDGQYQQDVILFAGESRFVYQLMLGRLEPGKHRVTVRLNQARSAPGAQRAIVLSLHTIPLVGKPGRTADDLLALAHSPVLYQRPNTIDRFSDLPLLMYYEVIHPNDRETLIRYTIIFTNEDGGTPTAALMARWGRAADIEWAYEFRVIAGHIVEEHYQSVAHETKPFKGEHINGEHPVLSVASDNNNFSDQKLSNVRFALLPIPFDLRSATRERVMDANPWTYRIVAEELLREGKLKDEPADLNSISDPRNYIYVDLRATQTGSSIGVAATSAKQSTPSFSDLENSKLRIDRSGNFRTAIRMTSFESASSVSSLTVRCYSALHDCEHVEVTSVAVLDRNYKPQSFQITRLTPRTLKPGDSLTIALH